MHPLIVVFYHMSVAPGPREILRKRIDDVHESVDEAKTVISLKFPR